MSLYEELMKRMGEAKEPSDFAIGVNANKNADVANRNIAKFEKLYREVMGHPIDSDEGPRFFDAFDHVDGDLAEFEHELVTNPGRFYLDAITPKQARALHAGIKKMIGEAEEMSALRDPRTRPVAVEVDRMIQKLKERGDIGDEESSFDEYDRMGFAGLRDLIALGSDLIYKLQDDGEYDRMKAQWVKTRDVARKLLK